MKNAKMKLFTQISVLTLGIALTISQTNAVLLNAKASAKPSAQSPVYCDDSVYLDDVDGSYNGQGVQTTASYDVYCDEVVINYVVHPSVPSHGNGDTSMTNTCGPVAGTNIVAYYDRWCTNLIPDYSPGGISPAGEYQYYPDLALDATCNVIESLYSLMKVPEVGGTTSANFKSGLNTYVTEAGYDLSYTSFYDSATTVDLTTLTNAINNGKIGLVMCSKYNFVYSITNVESEGYVHLAKINSTTGHMMMVYGYQTVAYYRDGVNFQTDTFLFACSGFGSCDIGWMQLNDFSVIDEAWIMTIE